MKQKKGFTIMELVIVIGLLIVVAGLFTFNAIRVMNKNKEDEIKNVERQLISAADAYVSMNPSAVQELYEGSGFVDIPVRDLRDGGLVNDDLKDPETGEPVPDEKKIRVRVDSDGKLLFEYDPQGDVDSSWKLEVKELILPSNDDNSWCNGINELKDVKTNVKLVNDETEATDAEYEKAKIRVKSCTVNRTKTGNYQIEYEFNDPENIEVVKTKIRKVTVVQKAQDVVSFSVKITNYDKTKIPHGVNDVNFEIEEKPKSGEPNSFSLSETEDYEIQGFSTNTIGERKATVRCKKANSDGTYPSSFELTYKVIPNIRAVTFNPNGGSVTPSNKQVTYSNTYGELPTPTRTGYTFDGWYTAPTGGTKITSSTKVTQIKDHTIHAQWTINKIYIQYNMNGGSWAGTTASGFSTDSSSYVLLNGSRNVHTINYGSQIDLANYNNAGWINISKTGHSAVNNAEWKNSSGKTFKQTGNIDSAGLCDASKGNCTAVLYVNWTPNNYYIDVNPIINGTSQSNGVNGYTFDVYVGGTKVATDVIDYYQQAPYGSSVRVVAKSKTGYNVTNQDQTKTLGAGTLIFNPTWTAKTYNLTVNANGGTMYNNGWIGTWNTTFTYGQKRRVSSANNMYWGGNTPSQPSRNGYEFAGWEVTSGSGSIFKGNDGDIPVHYFDGNSASDVTVTAKWTSSTVTVTYDANGGYFTNNDIATANSSNNDYSHTGNTQIHIPITYGSKYGDKWIPEDIKRTDYMFDGWYTSSTGGSKVYGTSVVNSTSNHTLYAHWIPKRTYFVKYYLENVSGTKYDLYPAAGYTKEVYGVYASPDIKSFEGFEYDDYEENSIAENQYEINVYYNRKNYIIDLYTNAMNYDGDANLPTANRSKISIKVWYGQSVRLPYLESDNYAFRGWYAVDNKVDGDRYTRISYSEKNKIPLYARWYMGYELVFKPNTSGNYFWDNYDKEETREYFWDNYDDVDNKTLVLDSFFRDGLWYAFTKINPFARNTSSIGVKKLYLGYSVREIGDYAFENNYTLEHVTIESVKTMGEGAFQMCDKLKTATFGNEVQEIGKEAFSGASILKTTHTGHDSVLKSIGEEAFYNCTSLIQLPITNSLTFIGDGAFANCKLITGVTLPDNFTELPGAFAGSGLTHFEISEKITSIGAGAFANCKDLHEITLPAGLKRIESSAFSGSGLEKIHIPDSVTYIGNWAFANCAQLDPPGLPKNLKYIGDYAFWQDYYPNTLTIPDSVTYIGQCAFADNLNLSRASTTSIHIGDSVETIGSSAFSGAVSKHLKTIYIGKNVKTIGDHAFYKGTTGATAATLTEPLIIPNSVTDIGLLAFYDVYADSLTLGENVKNISSSFYLSKFNSFYYKGNKYTSGDQLKSAYLNNGGNWM